MTDNGAVKKGQVLFRVDPQPFEIALRKAEADLAVAVQGAGVSAVDIGVAQAALQKQRVDLAASRQLGKIVVDLVNQRALAETNAIRARADISKTQADVRRAEAELERARQNLGAAGYANPKVQQSLAAPRRGSFDNTLYRPAMALVTNLPSAGHMQQCQRTPLIQYAHDGFGRDAENSLLILRRHHVLWRSTTIRAEISRTPWRDRGVSPAAEAPTERSLLPAAKCWLRSHRFPCPCGVDPADDERHWPRERSGAQANVMVFTDTDSILNPIGRLWMRIIATLSYLQ